MSNKIISMSDKAWKLLLIAVIIHSIFIMTKPNKTKSVDLLRNHFGAIGLFINDYTVIYTDRIWWADLHTITGKKLGIAILGTIIIEP